MTTIEAAAILRNFSFSDGQYLAHYTDGEICVMQYRNWQEHVFQFTFCGVALVRSYCGSSSLCEATISTDSKLIDDCRQTLSHDWGSSGGPGDIPLVELTIYDDVPLFSVVFTSVKIDGPLNESDRFGLATN